MKIFDISPTISSNLAVFPGDTPFSRQVHMDYSRGDHLQLSSIATTLHIGAHADSPSHYHPQGESIEKRSLHFYLGRCQVIDLENVLSPGELISPHHLKDIPLQAKRVLFRTNSFPQENCWNENFCALSPQLIPFLAKCGVILVGLDTPSVDFSNSKNLQSHQNIFSQDMAILEGLVLREVNHGLYTLIALPLKIEGGEASPVRAILLPESKDFSD